MPVEDRTLADRPPDVGDVFRLDAQTYEVTGVSTYEADGYSVVEWCCETPDSECYLLKESKPGEPVRWFFTRWIEPSRVTLPGEAPLQRWEAPAPLPSAPKTLLCSGDIFSHADTTDGFHDEGDGSTSRKVTWDFWNASRTRNVAIELWPDGSLDCYTGAYIQPSSLRYSARAAAASPLPLGLSPAAGFGVALPLCYLGLMLFLGLPFDECLTASAFCAAGAVLFALQPAPPVAAALIAGAGALAALFWKFPPLSTVAGVAGLLAAPLFGTLGLARLRVPAAQARFYCALLSAAPAAAVGAWHYFAYAPGPRGLEQLLLAYAPSAVGALAAAVASFAWMREDPA